MSRFLSKLTVVSAQGYGLIWGGTCADWGDEQQGMHATHLPYPGGYVRSIQFAAIVYDADTLSRRTGSNNYGYHILYRRDHAVLECYVRVAAAAAAAAAAALLLLLLLQLRDSEAVT